MAEGLLNYTRLDDPEDVIVETQGRPMSDVDEVQIVGPDDEPVAEGQMGALVTRGPYTPRGYFRAEQHNAQAFTPDGWYRTGDIVRWHKGNFIVEGRDKDLINRAGEKVSAEEVENLVYRLPGVSRVAAVAAPDPTLGERVAIVVVLDRGAGPVDLVTVRSALQGMGIAAYKLPEHLLVLDELPLTKIGKIDKKRLRDVVALDVTRRRPEP